MTTVTAFSHLIHKTDIGDTVHLLPEEDSIVPAGQYIVSKVNADGSFHVGGKTAIWPRRIDPTAA